MSLTLVAVPIGNLGDITLRALNSLKEADLYIGEERKPMFRLLKELGIETPKNYELLNEHSETSDLQRLSALCQDQKVVLLTDCGTPGFSDPGAELVALCRNNNIKVTSNPGASSLTTFLSLCGVRLTHFDFLGFPPREASQRTQFFKDLATNNNPKILMDTPYRLQRTIQECAQFATNKNMVLGIDLTKDNEVFYTGTCSQVAKNCQENKREFLCLLY